MALTLHDTAAQGGVTAYVAGMCDTIIWGMSGTERAERLLRRLGYEEIMIAGEPSNFGTPVLMLRADAVIEEDLLRAVAARADCVLIAPTERGYAALAAFASRERAGDASRFLAAPRVVPDEIARAGLQPMRPDDLVGSYRHALRKRARPTAAVLTEEDAGRLHRTTFNASYKGVTDVVTRYVWPGIAYPITRGLARLSVAPNHVTAAGLVLSLLAAWLFFEGRFAAGLASAWAMALLDTVDGKLARVTLTSSRWGNVFDHGIDLVAPPVWWLCWWVGLGTEPGSWLAWTVWVVLGGHVAGKLIEQAFISTFGLKVHIWQRFDSRFRLIAARRNPNLVILTAGTLFGVPDYAYVAMAAWIVVSFDVHTIRYIQAFVLRRKGLTVESWLQG